MWKLLEETYHLFFEKFHYSFFDITSVRKALSLIYPSQIKKIKDAKKLNHNSLVDCEDALNELKAILILHFAFC